ncbi:MAG: UPF0701 protein YloC, partial [uncultured Gemmatimonadetes bacterium]
DPEHDGVRGGGAGDRGGYAARRNPDREPPAPQRKLSHTRFAGEVGAADARVAAHPAFARPRELRGAAGALGRGRRRGHRPGARRGAGAGVPVAVRRAADALRRGGRAGPGVAPSLQRRDRPRRRRRASRGARRRPAGRGGRRRARHHLHARRRGPAPVGRPGRPYLGDRDGAGRHRRAGAFAAVRRARPAARGGARAGGWRGRQRGPAGAGDRLPGRALGHQRGAGALSLAQRALPRADGGQPRGAGGQAPVVPRPGDAPRGQHHRLQGQPRGDRAPGGGHQGRGGAASRAGGERGV